METPKPPKNRPLFLLAIWLLGLGLSFAASYLAFFMSSFGHMQRPRDATIVRRMDALADRLDSYKERHGRFPDTLQEVFTEKEREEFSTHYIPYDNWHNLIVYTVKGDTWQLLSYGADGQPGGVGMDADIIVTPLFDPFDKLKEMRKTARPTYQQVFQKSDRYIRHCFGIAVFFSFFHYLFLLIRECLRNERKQSEFSKFLDWGTALGVAFITWFFSELLNGIVSLGDVF